MGKNILVTGGFGYIGSHTVLALQEAGFRAVVFDKALPKTVEQKNWHFINGDLLNQADLKAAFASEKFDAVVHFAAYIEAGESVKDPYKYYQNNVMGTLNLLKAMDVSGIKVIVFSSTAAVYGSPSTAPIPESAPIAPINPYGASKAMVERLLEDGVNAYGLRPFILRYFNACGADLKGRAGEDHDPETHLIPLILQTVNGERRLKLFGDDYNTPDGTCVRDYVHVSDLAAAHVSALRYLLKSKKAGLEIVNLGTGTGYSNKQVLDAVEQVLGSQILFEKAPRRLGDPAILVADARKAMAILKWHPLHSDLLTIIRTAWSWKNRQQES